MSNPTTQIRFTITKRGERRAYRASRRSFRWFPMPLAAADIAIATGADLDVTAEIAAQQAELSAQRAGAR